MSFAQRNRQCDRIGICLLAAAFLLLPCRRLAAFEINKNALQVSVAAADGSYSIGALGLAAPVLNAAVSANVDGIWLRSSSYPTHSVRQSIGRSLLGSTTEWEVTFSGLTGKPDLIYRLRAYQDSPFGEIQAIVHNVGHSAIHVEAVRAIEATGSAILELGGNAEQDRVLSDSFSEDVPPIKIRDLKDTDGHLHRGVGSQLVYNRQSGWSFFAGALTTDRFLILLRLHLSQPGDLTTITSFEAESTGTTEITRENSLAESPSEDQVTLSLEVLPGAEISSERLLFGVSQDYHQQLETYGQLIKEIHRARATAPSAMGWWSWAAYYYGLSEGTVLTNAQWMAEHLAPLGFTYFHLDEGYQFARGEYSTPDATLFPNGMAAVEDKLRALGLTAGLWTAPFEVSERSSIFVEHPDWLVHNAQHKPIHLGWANNHHDRLYALDTTHPGAQEYLRNMYSKLVKDWGIRYLKLDFMDDSGIEGLRYRSGTTAMEAQRFGLETIRQAVGDHVMLDKDGSTMLNSVGYVDYGRIAQDTGHTFAATREAAPAIAARYYMNRNFFVNDPDAFTVSKQTIKDHPWNGGTVPLTLDEARVSIALSAVSGSMFEIGDDLPTLASSPERLALVTNKTLISMARLGRASIPIDLMTYDPADEQPSLFYRPSGRRAGIVTIFNWTNKRRAHDIKLSRFGLDPNLEYAVFNVFGDHPEVRIVNGRISVTQPGHSVRMFKVTAASLRNAMESLRIEAPGNVHAGSTVIFAARLQNPDEFNLTCLWSFGDGVHLSGNQVTHAYTKSGDYAVTTECTGPDESTRRASANVTVHGAIPSVFVPEAKKRWLEQ